MNNEKLIKLPKQVEVLTSQLDSIATLTLMDSGNVTEKVNSFINNNDNIIIYVGNGDFTFSGVDFKDKKVLVKGNGEYSNIIIEGQPTNTPGIFSNTVKSIKFENVKFTINFGFSRAIQPPMMWRYGNNVSYVNCIFDGFKSNEDIYTNIHIRGIKSFTFNNNEVINYKGYLIVGEGMNNGNTNIDSVSFVNNIINTTCDMADGIFNIDNEYNKDSIITIANNVCKKTSTKLLGHAFGVGFVVNATFTGNVIKNYHTGFDIDNPKRAVIANNIIVNDIGDFDNSKTTIGVRVGGSNPSQSHIDNRRCQDVIISNNYVYGYNQGLSLGSDLYNANINNNTIENCINLIYCYKLYNSDIKNNKFICGSITSKMLRLFCINDSQICGNTFENKNNVTTVLLSIVSSTGLESNNVVIKDNINLSKLSNTSVFEGLANCTNIIVIDNKGINDTPRGDLSKLGVMIPNFVSEYDNIRYIYTNTITSSFSGTLIDTQPVDTSFKQLTSNGTITKKHTNTLIKNGSTGTFDYSVTPIQECLGMTFVIENVSTSVATINFVGYSLNINLIASGTTLSLNQGQRCIVHYNKGDSKVYASVI